jgi:pyrroloquinoline quinone biosynthesis protein D
MTGKPTLLYPEGAMLLNATALAILELCTGENTLNSITSALSSRFQGDKEQIERAVYTSITKLAARRLVDFDRPLT